MTLCGGSCWLTVASWMKLSMSLLLFIFQSLRDASLPFRWSFQFNSVLSSKKERERERIYPNWWNVTRTGKNVLFLQRERQSIRSVESWFYSRLAFSLEVTCSWNLNWEIKLREEEELIFKVLYSTHWINVSQV